MAGSNTLTQAQFITTADVSAETAARFEAWRALLVKWNARVNLVGASTLADFWRRHALDCVAVHRAAMAMEEGDRAPKRPQRWLDLGAGAGAPGLGVALLAQDAGAPADITLVEANGKKAAFLREAARKTGAGVIVAEDRAEHLPAGAADIITARAFAPLPDLLAHMHRLAKPGACGVFLKGRGVEEEVTAARALWRFDHELLQPLASPDGRVLRVRNLSPV